MANKGQFAPGADPRRNTTSGRAPTPATMAAAVRATLGRNFRNRLLQLEVLADSGDPSAVVACAVLLSAAMGQQCGNG